jgi:hypothetical protein
MKEAFVLGVWVANLLMTLVMLVRSDRTQSPLQVAVIVFLYVCCVAVAHNLKELFSQ